MADKDMKPSKTSKPAKAPKAPKAPKKKEAGKAAAASAKPSAKTPARAKPSAKTPARANPSAKAPSRAASSDAPPSAAPPSGAPPSGAPRPSLSAPRLKEDYDKTIRHDLAKRFGFKNIMAVPRLEKIVINMGIGEAVQDRKKAESAAQDLTRIAGQRAVVTRARQSEANFKLRAGQPIGAKVTLRRARMYEFIDRLITIALPRTRDFRGLNPKSFDGRGNYTFGIREHIVFPEVDYDKTEAICGMDITICTRCSSRSADEEARALLEAFRFPFADEKR